MIVILIGVTVSPDACITLSDIIRKDIAIEPTNIMRM
ncbi:hypothetical protein ES703_83554 [subsurface metagenome]